MLSTKTIGDKIAEARKKLNISQAQLAEKLFISAQAVGKWERGESMPDIITLNRLAEIFGLDLNYFSGIRIGSQTALENHSEELNTDIQPKKLTWDMSRGNWVNADFSGLKNLQEKFSSSNMQTCKFIGSDLSGLLLKSNNVDACDFSNSNISNSQIQNSNLDKNKFTNCLLKNTEFIGNNIGNCDFSNADFTGTTFKSGNFEKNTLTNAVWINTSFIAMNIDQTVFDGTFQDCYFENSSFYKVKFENAKLINTFFKNKSLKRIQFVNCQADRMTYEFLKNGKADLSGISLF